MALKMTLWRPWPSSEMLRCAVDLVQRQFWTFSKKNFSCNSKRRLLLWIESIIESNSTANIDKNRRSQGGRSAAPLKHMLVNNGKVSDRKWRWVSIKMDWKSRKIQRQVLKGTTPKRQPGTDLRKTDTCLIASAVMLKKQPRFSNITARCQRSNL